MNDENKDNLKGLADSDNYFADPPFPGAGQVPEYKEEEKPLLAPDCTKLPALLPEHLKAIQGLRRALLRAQNDLDSAKVALNRLNLDLRDLYGIPNQGGFNELTGKVKRDSTPEKPLHRHDPRGKGASPEEALSLAEKKAKEDQAQADKLGELLRKRRKEGKGAADVETALLQAKRRAATSALNVQKMLTEAPPEGE